jgi:hypothetical protein
VAEVARSLRARRAHLCRRHLIGQGETSGLSVGGEAAIAAAFGGGAFLWAMWTQIRWKYAWEQGWNRMPLAAWTVLAACAIGVGLVAGSLAT